MALEDLDDDLRALAVHDVSPERAERIRTRCVEALTERAGRIGRPARARAYWNWLEPAAALGVSVVYLAAAVRAATVLMLLR